MTVAELIAELDKIEDKTKKIFVYSFDDWCEPSDVVVDPAYIGEGTVLII